MAMRPSDDFDRDLPHLPERFDADADSHQARAGHRLRTGVTLVLAVVAVGAIVAAGLHFIGGRKGGGMGVPVIKADDRPIKVRPTDPGGMQVPNQDKLVYERMEQGADAEPKVERLLPQAEAPKMPPKTVAPVTESAPPLQPPVATRPAPAPPKPGEPPAPKTAPVAKVVAQAVEPSSGYQPTQARPTAPEKVSAAQVAAVPATPPPAAASPAVSAKAPASGEYVIQLGAVRAADIADKEWTRIQKVNADILGGLHSDIVRVELEGKGVYWRIRAAPLSEMAARQLCAELATRNQGCIVARK
ncbi:Periplasmic protein TonB [Candidatus Terasakiella magnetica]|nr:Periplasmic protein TonB [Candidatus Terasakiella magnetica]